MPALFGTKSRVPRNLMLGCAIIASVYLLLRSLDVGPFGPHASFFIAPSSTRLPRITKVTERIAPVNELYQGSLKSHKEHDRLHGYGMRLFEEEIVDASYSLATNLLGMIVSELQKPEDERATWLVWFSGDVVLLNPQIPLEIFLPPRDFDFINFLATRDENGFNAGVFFIRVRPWSVDFLIDVLAHSKMIPPANPGAYKHQTTFESALKVDKWRGNVVWQPRQWYNTFARDAKPDANSGRLLVHFNSPDGDKWAGMAETLDELAKSSSAFSIPLGRTTYAQDVLAYWNRMREVYALLSMAEARLGEHAVQEAVRRAQYAIAFETDEESVMKHAINLMKTSIGITVDSDGR